MGAKDYDSTTCLTNRCRMYPRPKPNKGQGSARGGERGGRHEKRRADTRTRVSDGDGAALSRMQQGGKSAGEGASGSERAKMEAEGAAPTRIMVAVNQSSIKGYPHPSISSRTAFDWALTKIIRSNTSEFKLLFLHVQVPDEDAFDDMDSIYASPDDFKRMASRDRKTGLHLLEYFVEHCHQIGVTCEAWIKKGDPSEVICKEVKKVRPDLLVVGNRGLGPFQRVFVGTVSEFCVKHAECPVVTIRRNREEAPSDPVDD